MVAPSQTQKLKRTRQQHTDNRPLDDVQRQASNLEDVTFESLENISVAFELLTAIASRVLSSYAREASYLSAMTIPGPAYTTVMDVALGPLAEGQTVIARSQISNWAATGGGNNSRQVLTGPATLTGGLQYFPNDASNHGMWSQVDTFEITQAGSYTLSFQIQGGSQITISSGAGYIIDAQVYGLQL